MYLMDQNSFEDILHYLHLIHTDESNIFSNFVSNIIRFCTLNLLEITCQHESITLLKAFFLFNFYETL